MKSFGTIIAAIIGIIGFLVILCLLISIPVMLLWNCLIPILFPPHDGVALIAQNITWLQALGLMFLTSFLFKSASVSKSS